MNKYFLSIITIMLIIAMVFTACNRGSERTEGSTQQQTASQEQTQTDAESNPQILTGNLPTFAEGAAEENNINNLFIHTEENPINIWGWSKDGKVGISEIEFNDTRGGRIIKAFVFDAVSDTVLWQNNIDSFDFGEEGIPEFEIKAFFNNFLNICRQQFGINIQEGRLLAPSNTVIRHYGIIFNVIINADIEEDGMIRRNSVIVETNDGRKTIQSEDTFLPSLPVFYRYSISPFEERALIIVRWNSFSHSYGFRYAGCHLAVGFTPFPPGEAPRTFTVSSTDFEMVRIQGGTFTMGSPTSEAKHESDETQHQVTLTGFYMGKYPITQAQYEAVMGSDPNYFHGGRGREPYAGETQKNRPVESVSWYDAIVFCNKLSMNEGLTPVYRINGSTNPADWGSVPTNSNTAWNAVQLVAGNGYRLPTEAQWEYACRAGTTTASNTGDTINNNTGWCLNNSGEMTHEVGKKPPNAYGLYDMHGNVWEWCWDWYGDYSSGAQTDPYGAVSGNYQVKRGGSWYIDGQSLRSAFRSFNYPIIRVKDIGFRLVRP